MGGGGVQHEALGAGGGDDAGGQQDVEHRLQEQEHLGDLQVRAVWRGGVNIVVYCNHRCPLHCGHVPTTF